MSQCGCRSWAGSIHTVSNVFMILLDAARKGEGRREAAHDYSHACSLCGTGSKQVGPLRLRRSDLPRSPRPAHRIIETWDGDLLVHESLIRSLVELGDHCLEFREVEVKGAAVAPDWWQLVTTIELGPMRPETTAIEQDKRNLLPCAACGRDGWYDKPKGGVVAYDAVVERVFREHVVAMTWERFGRAVRGEYWASPRYAVSAKLRSVLDDHRQRHVRYLPVCFIDG